LEVSVKTILAVLLLMATPLFADTEPSLSSSQAHDAIVAGVHSALRSEVGTTIGYFCSSNKLAGHSDGLCERCYTTEAVTFFDEVLSVDIGITESANYLVGALMMDFVRARDLLKGSVDFDLNIQLSTGVAYARYIGSDITRQKHEFGVIVQLMGVLARW